MMKNKQNVYLVFGYDYYKGSIEVTPHNMVEFLKIPFAQWLGREPWKNHKIEGIDRSEFYSVVFDQVSNYPDDCNVQMRDMEWVGFSALVQKDGAICEFTFTTDTQEFDVDVSSVPMPSFALAKVRGIAWEAKQILREYGDDEG